MMNNFLFSAGMIFVEGVKLAALTLFAIAIVLGFKNLFEEEEFDMKESIRESITALIAFTFFFVVSGESITLRDGVFAILAGITVGYTLSAFVKLHPKWLTKGGLLFIVLWCVSVFMTKASETVMAEFAQWWLILGFFSAATQVGHLLNINMRQKHTNRQK